MQKNSKRNWEATASLYGAVNLIGEACNVWAEVEFEGQLFRPFWDPISTTQRRQFAQTARPRIYER